MRIFRYSSNFGGHSIHGRWDGLSSEHPKKVEGGDLHALDSGGVLKLLCAVSMTFLDLGHTLVDGG